MAVATRLILPSAAVQATIVHATRAPGANHHLPMIASSPLPTPTAVPVATPDALRAQLRRYGDAVRAAQPGAPVRTAFAPFADPIIFLFIGSFMLAEAMFVFDLKDLSKPPVKIEVARQSTTSETIEQQLIQITPSRKDRSFADKRAVLRALILFGALQALGIAALALWQAGSLKAGGIFLAASLGAIFCRCASRVCDFASSNTEAVARIDVASAGECGSVRSCMSSSTSRRWVSAGPGSAPSRPAR